MGMNGLTRSKRGGKGHVVQVQFEGFSCSLGALLAHTVVRAALFRTDFVSYRFRAISPHLLARE